MKKKVLHVLPSNDVAGAENVAICIISNLSDSYECVYASPEGGIINILEDRGITHLPIKSFTIGQIRQVIKEWKPEIIHAHDFRATVKCILSCFSIPVIAHIHQNPEWLQKMNIRIMIFFLACFKLNKIIAVSPPIKEKTFLSSFPFKSKTEVISNIVDINWITKNADLEKVESYDLAFIGRFEDVKDPIRFINIVFEVVKKLPQLKVIMMGGGTLEEDCKKAIESKNIQSNITLKGFSVNPYPVLKNSKILVMTSKSEGLPIVALEALSLGTPVVVPQLTGIDSIIDRSCGFICSTDAVFVDSIITLLTSKQLQEEMSLASYKKAKTICSMDMYTGKLKQVYSDAIHK